jgi:uncharacterized oxidoreductase
VRSFCARGPQPGFRTHFRVLGGLTKIIMRLAAFGEADNVNREVEGFVAWMKSARPRQKGGEILSPGEPERRLRKQRLSEGLPIDDITWKGLLESAAKVGITDSDLERIVGSSVKAMS